MKNYYKILRLPLLSSVEMVKSAYRELALKYHPDKNGGSAFYNEYFRDIKEAHDFLIVPENKNKYDELISQNPDYIEITDLSTIDNKNSIKGKQIPKSNSKKKYIFGALIFLVLSIFIFLVVSLYNLNNKTIRYKNKFETAILKTNETSQKLTEIGKKQKEMELARELQSQKIRKEATQNPMPAIPNNTIQRPAKTNKIPDYFNVHLNIGSDRVILINKNNYTIDRVEVSYTRTNVFFPRYSSVPYEFETKTYLNVEPGNNTVEFGDNGYKSGVVLSCTNY